MLLATITRRRLKLLPRKVLPVAARLQAAVLPLPRVVLRPLLLLRKFG